MPRQRAKRAREGPEATCIQCGLVFRAWDNSYKARFCSNMCSTRNKIATGRIFKRGQNIPSWECLYCKSPFKRYPRVVGGTCQFCSDKCKMLFLAYKKAIVTCQVCGIQFETSYLGAKRTKFCSPKCWKKVRTRVRTESLKKLLIDSGREQKCYKCGYNTHPEILDIHHVDEDSSHNDPSNLEFVCPNCHAIIHRLKAQAVS